jgi:16S rRNA (cytosine967-C5)-methyltransferase
MLGLLRAAGRNPAEVFTGEGYAPAVLTTGEAAFRPPEIAALPRGTALDCPDWLMLEFERALGTKTDAVLAAMRERAPVILRVNARRVTREEAAQKLAAEGIVTKPHALASFALQVVDNASKIKTSKAYLCGLVELQDAAPQSAVEALPLTGGRRVLDFCAGGGGKTLAMAARADSEFFAHDAAPKRMSDLPARAVRAGVRVTTIATADLDQRAPFDLVLADVPCSGTGTWRRAPEAKWTLTTERLSALTAIQAEILERSALLVAPGGWLIYMTCSLLRTENRDQIDAFRKAWPGFTLAHESLVTPLDSGDGFYAAHLRRD